jgi:hypothetical protein
VCFFSRDEEGVSAIDEEVVALGLVLSGDSLASWAAKGILLWIVAYVFGGFFAWVGQSVG